MNTKTLAIILSAVHDLDSTVAKLSDNVEPGAVSDLLTGVVALRDKFEPLTKDGKAYSLSIQGQVMEHTNRLDTFANLNGYQQFCQFSGQKFDPVLTIDGAETSVEAFMTGVADELAAAFPRNDDEGCGDPNCTEH